MPHSNGLSLGFFFIFQLRRFFRFFLLAFFISIFCKKFCVSHYVTHIPIQYHDFSWKSNRNVISNIVISNISLLNSDPDWWVTSGNPFKWSFESILSQLEDDRSSCLGKLWSTKVNKRFGSTFCVLFVPMVWFTPVGRRDFLLGQNI